MQSPFKFLDSYTREDRDIFFGRDREIDELYQKVFESKILLLYGISGTGKTSLINCGLANKFEESDWLPINIRRGKDINESLNSEIRKLSLTKLKDGSALHKAIQSVYLDHFKPIYLIFDQFEELFIFGDRKERDELIHSISQLIKSDVQCRCLFSIREEYLAGVTEFESYIPEFLSNRMRVEKMTHQQATEVIEGPCGVNEIELEEGFADSLLNKLNPDSREIELTYLQVFLDKILKLSGDSGSFTQAHIDKVGDVSDLLGSFLEEQINELEDPEAGLVVLKAFVSMQGTRKQIVEEEILDFAQTLGNPIAPDQLSDLLQRFVNLRVLKDKDEHNQYELRHDSLAVKIYEKITLVEKELLEVKEFLDNAYNNFERRGIWLNEADLKYIAPYEDKLFLSKKLHQFIADSRNEIVKTQRRRRRFIAAAAILLITILTFFTAWAVRERGKAVNQSKIAEEQRTEAIAARDLAIQAQEEADRARNEAEESRIVAEESREEEATAKIEALQQKQLADSALVIAEYQRGVSEEQKQLAQEAQKEAEVAAERVREASRNSMFQLYLFNAKEFANKSLLENQNDTIEALLALMSFELNDYAYDNYSGEYQTKQYEIEMFEALQKAFLRFENDTLFTGEIWAMDIVEDMMVISSRKNSIFLSPLFDTYSDQYQELLNREKLNTVVTDQAGSDTDSENTPFIRAILTDSDSHRIITGNSDGEVLLTTYENHSVEQTRYLYSHDDMVSSLEFSDDRSVLISSGLDGIMKCFDMDNGAILLEKSLHEPDKSLIFQNEEQFVFHDRSGNIFIHSIRAAEYDRLNAILRLDDPIDAIAYEPKSGYLAVCNSGIINLINLDKNYSDPANWKAIQPPQEGMISSLVFSPDGNWMAASSLGGEISLWYISSFLRSETGGFSPIMIRKPGLKIVNLHFDPMSNYLIFGDMQKLFKYPITQRYISDKLRAKLNGRELSESEWNGYKRGEIEMPAKNTTQ